MAQIAVSVACACSRSRDAVACLPIVPRARIRCARAAPREGPRAAPSAGMDSREPARPSPAAHHRAQPASRLLRPVRLQVPLEDRERCASRQGQADRLRPAVGQTPRWVDTRSPTQRAPPPGAAAALEVRQQWRCRPSGGHRYTAAAVSGARSLQAVSADPDATSTAALGATADLAASPAQKGPRDHPRAHPAAEPARSRYRAGRPRHARPGRTSETPSPRPRRASGSCPCRRLPPPESPPRRLNEPAQAPRRLRPARCLVRGLRGSAVSRSVAASP